MRVVDGDGHVPICSPFCLNAWPRVRDQLVDLTAAIARAEKAERERAEAIARAETAERVITTLESMKEMKIIAPTMGMHTWIVRATAGDPEALLTRDGKYDCTIDLWHTGRGATLADAILDMLGHIGTR